MNVSLSELIVVLLIALIVIKPEQMPEVARTLGRLFFSIRRLFAKVKDEMNGIMLPVDKNNEHQ